MKGFLKKLSAWICIVALSICSVSGGTLLWGTQAKAEDIHFTVSKQVISEYKMKVACFRSGYMKGEELVEPLLSLGLDDELTEDITETYWLYKNAREEFVQVVLEFCQLIYGAIDQLPQFVIPINLYQFINPNPGGSGGSNSSIHLMDEIYVSSEELRIYAYWLQSMASNLEMDGNSEIAIWNQIEIGIDWFEDDDLKLALKESYASYVSLKQELTRLIDDLLEALLASCPDDVLPFGYFETPAGYLISNPRSTESLSSQTNLMQLTTEWDCIWIGNYWHTYEADLIEENTDPVPLKWRVLSINGTDAFVVADRCVDKVAFHTENTNVTWEDSYMREWLNNYFYQTAFSEKEKEAIRTTDVDNNQNPFYEDQLENSTQDKIYLLSVEEVTNSDYGFDSAKKYVSSPYDPAYATYWYDSPTRLGKDIVYTLDLEAPYYNDPAYGTSWWLRSAGYYPNERVYVYHDGYLDCRGGYLLSDNSVRPCMHIDLASDAWSYAGTVSSEGRVMQVDPSEHLQVTKSIEDAVVSGIKDKTYTGKEIIQKLTVKLGENTLTEETDYTVLYSDNVNAGTVEITITGTGLYYGSITKTFTIKPKKITPKVTLSETEYVYNGLTKTPKVTVKDGSKVLAKVVDYSVSYASGRKTPGTYKVTVKLKNNYSGSKTVSFVINPKGTTIASVNAASKAFTVKWKKQEIQTTGYQIQYSTSSKFASGNKMVTVAKNSTVSRKISGLKTKKKYYVRMRTYKTVSGKKYYSAWSKSKAVTTK